MSTTYTTNESPYLGGSATYVPEHEPSIWRCPDCLAAGVENHLLYSSQTRELACPCCPARYADDAAVADAYVDMAGELKGDLDRANAQLRAVESGIEQVREVFA